MNPGTEVAVGDNGETTVTFPDGSTATLTPAQTVQVAINGQPDSVDLPKLIITKWVDENGKELKPADAKAPTQLGEANEAFEHGEISGYIYVKTITDEAEGTVTHIFKKVLEKPESNKEDSTKVAIGKKVKGILPATGLDTTESATLGFSALLAGIALAVRKRREEE